MLKYVLSIFVATIWISFSEFFRNEFLLKSYWVNHYSSMGLVFPSEPVNGMIWGIWSLVFAVTIFWVSRKFDFKNTIALCWVFGFVLMWLVTGNMGVLPYKILFFAVPASLLEVGVANYLIVKVSGLQDSQRK